MLIWSKIVTCVSNKCWQFVSFIKCSHQMISWSFGCGIRWIRFIRWIAIKFSFFYRSKYLISWNLKKFKFSIFLNKSKDKDNKLWVPMIFSRKISLFFIDLSTCECAAKLMIISGLNFFTIFEIFLVCTKLTFLKSTFLNLLWAVLSDEDVNVSTFKILYFFFLLIYSI